MSINYIRFPQPAHQRKAEHNMVFSEDVTGLAGDYKDWQIIAIFYAAMHLVQGYFAAKSSLYPQTHQDRDHAIADDVRLRVIYFQYRELKTASLHSRYLCLPVNSRDVEDARKNYAIIRSHIERLLVN
jgi:hypothetical protein